MSVSNIFDPTTNKINVAYIPAAALPAGVVFNPMTSDLDCATFDVHSADRMNCTNLETESVSLTPGSLAPGIQINNSLDMTAGSELRFAADAVIQSGIGVADKIELDAPNGKILLNNLIDNTATPFTHVVGYDVATNEIKYQISGTPENLEATLLLGNDANGQNIVGIGNINIGGVASDPRIDISPGGLLQTRTAGDMLIATSNNNINLVTNAVTRLQINNTAVESFVSIKPVSITDAVSSTGTPGQILSAGAGGGSLTWIAPPSGGPTTEVISGTTAVSNTINTSLVSGTTHALSAPPAASSGFIKNIVGTNTANAFSVVQNGIMGGFSRIVRTIKYTSFGAAGRVYVGGLFSSIDGVSASNIAYYDIASGTWSALGLGTDNIVFDIAWESGNSVFVAGQFSSAGGTAGTNGVALYNQLTGNWSSLGGTGIDNGQVNRCVVNSSYLYITGTFSSVGGGIFNTSYVARFDRALFAWSGMGSGLNFWGYDIIEITGANPSANGIWVAGAFSSAGGVPNTGFFARWDGVSWNGYNGALQLSGAVRAICQRSSSGAGQNQLVLAGEFIYAGFGNAVYYTGIYDTVATTLVEFGGGGPAFSVERLFKSSTDDIYLLGGFTSSFGIEYLPNKNFWNTGGCGVIKFNPATNLWSPFGASRTIYSMAEINPATPNKIWIGGQFDNYFGFSGAQSLVEYNSNNHVVITGTFRMNGKVYTTISMPFFGNTVNLVNDGSGDWVIYNMSSQSNAGSFSNLAQNNYMIYVY